MKCYAQLLPERLKIPLFGDRGQHGLVPDQADHDWLEWISRYNDFYVSTQKGGVGKIVNDAGYHVLKQVDIADKIVCEIGPGFIAHKPCWNGIPREFIALDVSDSFLSDTASRLQGVCPLRMEKVVRDDPRTPLADDSVDVLLSFYSLEHLTPLDAHLSEFHRILKPGGLLVGAVPNEGGLAWGLGRYLTSRRWIQKNTGIDYDKIICWEHPNFIDRIIGELDRQFTRKYCTMYPLPLLPLADLNLVTKFIYQKSVT